MGKRIVSNEEIKLALQNSDNIKTMNTVISKYNFDSETGIQIQLDALWKCLAYHMPNKGRKFTTNLYFWTERICIDYYNKIKKEKKIPEDFGKKVISNNLASIAIDSLSDIERQILIYKYQEKKTYKKIAQELDMDFDDVREISVTAREKLWCIINKGENYE